MHTRKISDLTLLHKNIGGGPNSDLDTEPTIRTDDLTIVQICQTKYESCDFTDCVTNSGTIKLLLHQNMFYVINQAFNKHLDFRLYEKGIDDLWFINAFSFLHFKKGLVLPLLILKHIL